MNGAAASAGGGVGSGLGGGCGPGPGGGGGWKLSGVAGAAAGGGGGGGVAAADGVRLKRSGRSGRVPQGRWTLPSRTVTSSEYEKPPALTVTVVVPALNG